MSNNVNANSTNANSTNSNSTNANSTNANSTNANANKSFAIDCVHGKNLIKINSEISKIESMINLRENIVTSYKKRMIETGYFDEQSFTEFFESRDNYNKDIYITLKNNFIDLTEHVSSLKICKDSCPPGTNWNETRNICDCDDSAEFVNPYTMSCMKCGNDGDKDKYTFDFSKKTCICKDPEMTIQSYDTTDPDTNEVISKTICVPDINPKTNLSTLFDSEPGKILTANELFQKALDSINKELNIVLPNQEYCLPGMTYETSTNECKCEEPYEISGKVNDYSDPPKCACIVKPCEFPKAQHQDPKTCECVWNNECHPSQKRNKDTGLCECEPFSCPANTPSKDNTSCTCYCDLTKNNRPPPNKYHIFDNNNCSWKCNSDIKNICTNENKEVQGCNCRCETNEGKCIKDQFGGDINSAKPYAYGYKVDPNSCTCIRKPDNELPSGFFSSSYGWTRNGTNHTFECTKNGQVCNGDWKNGFRYYQDQNALNKAIGMPPVSACSCQQLQRCTVTYLWIHGTNIIRLGEANVYTGGGNCKQVPKGSGHDPSEIWIHSMSGSPWGNVLSNGTSGIPKTFHGTEISVMRNNDKGGGCMPPVNGIRNCDIVGHMDISWKPSIKVYNK
jgi:hypothetical protein